MNHCSVTLALLLVSPIAAAAVLDHQKLLQAQTFWDNRDFTWFEDNIPFLDTPDVELNTTYYYRWELVTKHLTYGSPDTGYVWTEFINRPFWSGAYGAISCPSGHQFNEARWLRNSRYTQDFARYWFGTPGAEPRKYSSWMAASAWETYLVHPDKEFIIGLLPDLVENFKGWEQRQWVPEMGMFWQVGHDDGMEFNIASRQTKNILSGAPSYRPSFNTYMWADETAISRIAELAGDHTMAEEYQGKANALRKTILEKLWDPKRHFFFPMFRDTETDKEGNMVEKNTLIYESGKYAGSLHGREQAGYVPWAFGMPDAKFDSAWKFLMDPYYFYADFGPTTVERNDPQFLLSPGCCWWSGQSWPFATTQTLKALANVLHDDQQEVVSRADYYKLLSAYSKSQRKNGKPYIAEALNPVTGSWDGHDMYYRSEHYFHSGFVDLIITGLAGLRVAVGDTLIVDPLAPSEWDYFAMDNIPYQGHLIDIVWDKTGEKYGKGIGFQVLIDGARVASSPNRSKLEMKLPKAKPEPVPRDTRVNHAVNNDGSYYPRLTASHVGPKSSLAFLQDGNTAWYHMDPPVRWTTEGSKSDIDWVVLDLGTPRAVDEIRLYFLDDGEGHEITAPGAYELEYANGDGPWSNVPDQTRSPKEPNGHMPNDIRFPETKMTKIRVMLKNTPGKRSGMTEIEAWGRERSPYPIAPPPSGDMAFNPKTKKGFPAATASFSDQFGGTPDHAIDGNISFRPTPMNRWTSYGSPNATDWLEVNLGVRKRIGKVLLHIFSDGGGVKAPKSYVVEGWTGAEWKEIPNQTADPGKPTGGMINTVTFPPVSTDKVRVVFTHIGGGDSRSGVTEIELWEK